MTLVPTDTYRFDMKHTKDQIESTYFLLTAIRKLHSAVFKKLAVKLDVPNSDVAICRVLETDSPMFSSLHQARDWLKTRTVNA